MNTKSASTIKRLLPEIKTLRREEKLFLMQFLVSELAQQEGVSLLPNLHYPVWSPHEAFEASAILMHLLDESGKES